MADLFFAGQPHEPGKEISVYEVTRAEQTTAKWVQSLLAPALEACKVQPRPIEFRPCGVYAGWFAADANRNPDGRISLSNQARFYSKTSLVCLYIHEICHSLLEQDEAGRHGHDAAFFSVNLALLFRLDAADYLTDERGTDWKNRLDLYDLQDAPACWCDAPESVWKPRALGWAMAQAEKLAPSDMSAERLADEIAQRYWKWAAEMQAEPLKRAQRQERNALEAQKRKSDLQLFQCLSLLFCAAFFVVSYVHSRG